jgi:hypothetical protein
MKPRPWRCEKCGRSWAHCDALRRHIEGGCPGPLKDRIPNQGTHKPKKGREPAGDWEDVT